MNEKRIDTNETPHVMLQACRGNITIGSWIRKAVTVTGETFTSEAPEPDLVTITADTEAQVMLPPHSRLTIEDVQGNLTIKNVDGLIKIGQVQGELTLRNVGNVQVDAVRGEVEGDGISGPLTVGEGQQPITLRNCNDVTIRRAEAAVSIRFANGRIAIENSTGDVMLHTISGDVNIDRAGANVTLSNLGGQNRLPDVQGTIYLVGGLVGGEHNFSAQESIFVYWPRTAPVNLIATAPNITNLLPLRQEVESSQGKTKTLTGYIENRKTYLILKTPGRIGLTTWDEDGEPAYVESDFAAPAPPAAAAPGTAESATAETAPNVDTAVAQAVTRVINRIDLELGPEWGRRFAALELEDKFSEAIAAELAQVKLVPAEEAAPQAEAPSPGEVAFAKAEKKVRKSLQQAADTMDQARQRLAKSAEPEESKAAAETAQTENAGPIGEPATAVPDPNAETDETAAAADSRTPAQLRILDMLEKGTISVEDASKLLQSLSK